jgi:hypothetical protein
MTVPSFDEFAVSLRKFLGVSAKRPISRSTRFEKDFGVTGEDGVDVLEWAAKTFGAELASNEHGYRQTFGLGENEYLFNSEGFGCLLSLFWPTPKTTVREFTIGELYDAVCQTQRH